MGRALYCPRVSKPSQNLCPTPLKHYIFISLAVGGGRVESVTVLWWEGASAVDFVWNQRQVATDAREEFGSVTEMEEESGMRVLSWGGYTVFTSASLLNLSFPKGTAFWFSWKKAGNCCLQQLLEEGPPADTGPEHGALHAFHLLLCHKEVWEHFSQRRSNHIAEGLAQDTEMLCISEPIYIYAD